MTTNAHAPHPDAVDDAVAEAFRTGERTWEALRTRTLGLTDSEVRDAVTRLNLRLISTPGFRYVPTTLGAIDSFWRKTIYTDARPHGLVRTVIDLYESDGINADAPMIIVFRGAENWPIFAWGLLRGYLSVSVVGRYRQHGIGSEIVRRFVESHGSDLLFSSQDPSAIKMFRRGGLTRGPVWKCETIIDPPECATECRKDATGKTEDGVYVCTECGEDFRREGARVDPL